MQDALWRDGYDVNRERIQRLMQLIGTGSLLAAPRHLLLRIVAMLSAVVTETQPATVRVATESVDILQDEASGTKLKTTATAKTKVMRRVLTVGERVLF